MTDLYVQPHTRSSITWTSDLIRAAEIYAQGGSIRLAADLVDDMLGDDRIGQAVRRRAGGLYRKTMTFEAGIGRRKHAAVRAMEAGEDYLSIFPEDKYHQLKAYALMLNVSPGTIDWKQQKNGRVLPCLNIWHPRHFRFDTTRGFWLATTANRGEVQVTPGDGIWYMHCPFGKDRPWIWGLWRGLARWWLLKQYAINDWGVASDEIRVKVVSQDPGIESTPEERKQLARDIREMGRRGVLVLPPGYTYEIIEQKADTWEIYQAQINMANMVIDIVFSGNNLGTEIHDSSQAAAKTAAPIEDGFLAYDGNADGTFAHDQIFEHWADLNYGNPDLAPWPCWDTEPPEDQDKKASTFDKVANALSKLNDLPPEVDRRALLEEYGVPCVPVSAAPVPAPVAPESAPAEAEETPAQGDEVEAADSAPAEKKLSQIYLYDLQYKIVTTNERRAALGLPPVPGGDVPPDPPQTAAVPGQGLSTVRLASGVDPSTRIPFVEGQLATDALADGAAGIGVEAMAPSLRTVLDAIDAATSYEALRASLPDLLRGLDPGAMAEVVYRVSVMGQLVGQESVRQEVK